MLASQRSDPSSMFTSLTPSERSVVRRSVSHSRACAAERTSGSVTISASGVPPRLKSTTDESDPWMRPLAPAWTSFAASSSRCTRWMRTSPSRPALAQRLVVLADLVALGQVGIEVVLAVEDRPRRELASPSARPIMSPKWIARSLASGSVPGRPRQTGQVSVFGGSPNDSAQPQNIFVLVASWTWISRPMTGS